MQNLDELRVSQRFALLAPQFSKGQMRIAEYMQKNFVDVAYETAARVAAATGVSESTVVRFAIFLGYDGYPEFQSALIEELKETLSLPDRMNILAKLTPNQRSDFQSYVFEHDIELLRLANKNRDIEAFDQFIDSILLSKRVYITGVRSSAPLAGFLAYYLGFFLNDVRVILPGASSEMLEKILTINEEDCLIGISFPRYSERTLRTMAFAKDRKAIVCGITDRPTSPLAEYCTTLLTVPCDMMAIADSLTPAFSLITAIIAAASEKSGNRVEKSLDILTLAKNRFEQQDHKEVFGSWEAEYES